jgi:hypothetical protein
VEVKENLNSKLCFTLPTLLAAEALQAAPEPQQNPLMHLTVSVSRLTKLASKILGAC